MVKSKDDKPRHTATQFKIQSHTSMLIEKIVLGVFCGCHLSTWLVLQTFSVDCTVPSILTAPMKV